MTVNELSNNFDIKWEELVKANPSIEWLNEYEKSVYLTKSQELLFTKLYRNVDLDEFSKRVLTPLIKNFSTDVLTSTDAIKDLSRGKYTSISIDIPEGLIWILQEQLTTNNGRYVEVKPIKVDQYNILKSNPFRKPDIKKAWRVEYTDDYSYKTVEEEELLIPDDNNKLGKLELLTSYSIEDVDNYYCRYLMYPTPIILEDITDDNYKIRGYSKATGAVLNNIVHEEIVDMAVQLASKALYQSASKQ